VKRDEDPTQAEWREQQKNVSKKAEKNSIILKALSVPTVAVFMLLGWYFISPAIENVIICGFLGGFIVGGVWVLVFAFDKLAVGTAFLGLALGAFIGYAYFHAELSFYLVAVVAGLIGLAGSVCGALIGTFIDGKTV
jgi:hypothetical protein